MGHRALPYRGCVRMSISICIIEQNNDHQWYVIDVESLINDVPRAMIIYIRDGGDWDDVVMIDIVGSIPKN